MSERERAAAVAAAAKAGSDPMREERADRHVAAHLDRVSLEVGRSWGIGPISPPACFVAGDATRKLEPVDPLRALAELMGS